jgi:hypothetical protein
MIFNPVQTPVLPEDWCVYLGAFKKLRKGAIVFVTHICPSAWNNPAPNGEIFMKCGILHF